MILLDKPVRGLYNSLVPNDSTRRATSDAYRTDAGDIVQVSRHCFKCGQYAEVGAREASFESWGKVYCDRCLRLRLRRIVLTTGGF